MAPEPTQVSAVEVENIVDQMERAFEGDAWHGSSISEILAGISAEQAAAFPFASAHSIWEIVVHTSVWQRVVRERLQGKPLRSLPDDEDWPRIDDTSPTAWAQAVGELRTEYELLREEALRWRGRDLGETTEGQRYTVYEMLHGVIQHNLYHAGQIAILEKGELA